MTGGGLWSGMTERGRWQGVFICGHSGFPITNVGNDRRGSFVGNDRRSFVGNNRRGSFRMGERDAADVRDENHEATGFFLANGHNPAGPLPVTPAGAPPCHACRPFSVMPAGPPCHACRPLSVIPAGPSLSYLPAPLSCPPAPLCHARRPPSVMPAGSSLYACRPFFVMPVGPPLSFPQFLAGIQS